MKEVDGRGLGRSLRILVGDNDPNLAQFCQQFLPALGHQVFVVRTGDQLVETCRLLRPDLVIAGVALPEFDGIAAAEAVCRDQAMPVVLVVTAPPDPEVVRTALANPCVLACLFKPIKEADLAAAIALAAIRFGQFQALAKEAADLRQALEDRKLIERAKGMVMRYTGVAEEDAYRRLRKLASDQNRKLAEVAQAVLTAGEVFQQMEQVGEVKQTGDGSVRDFRRCRPHRNGEPARDGRKKVDRAG